MGSSHDFTGWQHWREGLRDAAQVGGYCNSPSLRGELNWKRCGGNNVGDHEKCDERRTLKNLEMAHTGKKGRLQRGLGWGLGNWQAEAAIRTAS